MAVGSNFTDEEPTTPPYVRAMALAIADRLISGSKPVRLADYQLKFRREPEEVARWSERETLAAALWESAWRIHGADQGTG